MQGNSTSISIIRSQSAQRQTRPFQQTSKRLSKVNALHMKRDTAKRACWIATQVRRQRRPKLKRQVISAARLTKTWTAQASSAAATRTPYDCDSMARDNAEFNQYPTQHPPGLLIKRIAHKPPFPVSIDEAASMQVRQEKRSSASRYLKRLGYLRGRRTRTSSVM